MIFERGRETGQGAHFRTNVQRFSGEPTGGLLQHAARLAKFSTKHDVESRRTQVWQRLIRHYIETCTIQLTRSACFGQNNTAKPMGLQRIICSIGVQGYTRD